MTRTKQDNARAHQTRRPCARKCGGNTMKHDVCAACRDNERRAAKGLHVNTKHGQGCHECEGLPWRRPARGKCKCGKRFALERMVKDAGLQRTASIFDALSTRV